METLEIVIGFIFIFLLLSLLATTVQELWSSVTSLRGKVLLKAIIKLLEIENMAGTEDGTRKRQVVEDFKKKIKESKVFKKYSSKFLWMERLPSYLSAEQMTAIIQELTEQENAAPTGYEDRSATGTRSAVLDTPSLLANIRHDDLRKQLNILHRSDMSRPAVTTRSATGEAPPPEVEEDESKIEHAKSVFKKHYDEIMNRATGWYKRTIQVNLMVIGMLIGLAFDADTFKMYSSLTHFPEDRQKLLEIAESFSDNNGLQTYAALTDTMQRGVAPSDTAAVQRIIMLRNLMDSILVKEIRQVPSPLGLGRPALNLEETPRDVQSAFLWRSGKFFSWVFTGSANGKATFSGVLQKIFGWFITALAVSLGAPFWFDMLQKVINIRNAGVRPQDMEKRQTKTGAQ